MCRKKKRKTYAVANSALKASAEERGGEGRGGGRGRREGEGGLGW